MNILIIKLGAAGDVVRTTCLLHVLRGRVDWLTSDLNRILLNGLVKIERLFAWSEREKLQSESYDLIINLEDALEVGNLLKTIRHKELFGAYVGSNNELTYTVSSKEWFDLSLISTFGKHQADELKLRNRRTYQDMIFRGLGYEFRSEENILPVPSKSNLSGDVAIAPDCGAVWPMKNWAYYNDLKKKLEEAGFVVSYLPKRNSVLEHIGDIQNHKYMISGDTLPMHLALASGINCLSIFTCTSPWEIYGYGLQRKVISPCLGEYFYKRHFDEKATTCIPLMQVYQEALEDIKRVCLFRTNSLLTHGEKA
jgi:heptosyltransferase-2